MLMEIDKKEENTDYVGFRVRGPHDWKSKNKMEKTIEN